MYSLRRRPSLAQGRSLPRGRDGNGRCVVRRASFLVPARAVRLPRRCNGNRRGNSGSSREGEARWPSGSPGSWRGPCVGRFPACVRPSRLVLDRGVVGYGIGQPSHQLGELDVDHALRCYDHICRVRPQWSTPRGLAQSALGPVPSNGVADSASRDESHLGRAARGGGFMHDKATAVPSGTGAVDLSEAGARPERHEGRCLRPRACVVLCHGGVGSLRDPLRCACGCGNRACACGVGCWVGMCASCDVPCVSGSRWCPWRDHGTGTV